MLHTATAARMLALLHTLTICTAAASPPPPAPCPAACEWDAHRKCCGVYTSSVDPEQPGTCACPPSLLFSAGFDSDMVLQRAPAKAAVYGTTLQAGATVEVTVSGGGGDPYTIAASVMPMQTYHGPAGANYTATWKAYLKPAPAGGSLTVTAKCTAGCGSGSGPNATKRDIASIERVTHGDVYFCSGQSNMALPLTHTFSAKSLQAEMLGGKYDELRFFQFGGMSAPHTGHQYAPTYTQQSGSMSWTPYGSKQSHTWFNASFSAGVQPVCEKCRDQSPPCGSCGEHVDEGPLMSMSATCIEFGRSLLDQRGSEEAAVPIGLIASAVGGTTIESWSPNATTKECQNTTTGGATAGKPRGDLFYGMACPFVNTSVAGFVFYQGENNMHGDPGSSLHGGGYGCMMPKMVAAWREIWSAEPGTTPPDTPFGIVTIAPSGSEGASQHLSAFRWAQTGNYGVLPNEIMPKTFLAQAYDLNDPWANAKDICSMNASITMHGAHSCTYTDSDTKAAPLCCQCGALANDSACNWDAQLPLWNKDLAPLAPLIKNSTDTHFFMGPIHPRLKAPVGRRLATSFIATTTGKGTVTGPTVSGCTYDKVAQTIMLHFNQTLLNGDSVAITRTQIPIPPPPTPDPEAKHPTKWTGPTPKLDSSLLHVCTGSAEDCSCLSWKANGTKKHHSTGSICEIPVDGGPMRAPQTRGDIWAEASIRLVPGGTAIVVNTSGLNMTAGGVHAVKFGWAFQGGTCCVDLTSEMTGLCIPGSCGVMTKESLLPLNPFFATIDGSSGKCKCPAPQQCDE